MRKVFLLVVVVILLIPFNALNLSGCVWWTPESWGGGRGAELIEYVDDKHSRTHTHIQQKQPTPQSLKKHMTTAVRRTKPIALSC